MLPQPPRGFSVSGLRLYFPHAGALGCAVCFAPHLFLPVYLLENVGPPDLPTTASLGPPGVALPQVLSVWLRVSTLPPVMDECFFFNYLVVGLPYSLIFYQLWLFFVYKLLLSLWLFEEAQCVYLRLHFAGSVWFLFLNWLLPFFWLCEEGKHIYLHLCLASSSLVL